MTPAVIIRLSYDPKCGILIVELARVAHEISLTDFGRAALAALDQLPIDHGFLHTTWKGTLNL